MHVVTISFQVFIEYKSEIFEVCFLKYLNKHMKLINETSTLKKKHKYNSKTAVSELYNFLFQEQRLFSKTDIFLTSSSESDSYFPKGNFLQIIHCSY